MELKKIRFKGFDVNSSSLEINDSTKGGKYRVRFDEHQVTSESDEDGNWVFVDVNPVVIGFASDSTDEENPVFLAKVSLTLSFECGFKDEVPQAFYEANAWFFEGFVYLATKLSIENILKDTVLDSINLPWSPKM